MSKLRPERSGPVRPFIHAVNTHLFEHRLWATPGRLRDDHTQTSPTRHSQPGRAAGHIKGHSQYSVVSVVLEVAQVTKGA